MPSRRVDVFDPAYPESLRALRSPPAALWVRGAVPTQPGVAIVGTRQPSDAAAGYAFDLAHALATAGFAVWSGGARGIDTAAHEGALAAAGPGVVAVGGGVDRPYPKENAALFARVVDGGGALVALVEDASPPRRWVFLARNGVLAAMTRATVLIECPLRSGARSTVASARKVGRPVWVAGQSPWARTAATVSEEARLGAKVFYDTGTLITALREQAGVFSPAPARARLPLPPPEGLAGRIWVALRGGPLHPDALCQQLGEPATVVQHALMCLALEGRVASTAPGYFIAVDA